MEMTRAPATLYDPLGFVGRSICAFQRTEYGLRAVVQLARLWTRTFVQARDLRSGRLPNKFLESITAGPAPRGISGEQGRQRGGYRLSRARPRSAGDIIRRLEGRLSLMEGVCPRNLSGPDGGTILMRNSPRRPTKVLDHMTLEELMEQVAGREPRRGNVYI